MNYFVKKNVNKKYLTENVVLSGYLYRLTKELFRLYSTPFLDRTPTSLPALVCTVYGSLSKFASKYV